MDKSIFPQENIQMIHILFGESAAGCMKVTISEMGLYGKEKVVCIGDFFSMGPIYQIHRRNNLEARFDWLNQNMTDDFRNYMDEYKQRLLQSIEQISKIDEEIPITIWTSENSLEQTGLRYVMYLLRNKANKLTIINTSSAFEKLFNKEEINFKIRSTGEVSPQKLQIIYKEYKEKLVLSEQDRQGLVNEWVRLSETRENLRIWENNEIIIVPEDYFDKMIIQCADYLHKETNKMDFMKSARIIGEVLGNIEEYVGDLFLEYRLRKLIEKGIFEVEGNLNAMRFYSVKLRKESF